VKHIAELVRTPFTSVDHETPSISYVYLQTGVVIKVGVVTHSPVMAHLLVNHVFLMLFTGSFTAWQHTCNTPFA
jgi:hypothetical protein